jgi:hypothetical protein
MKPKTKKKTDLNGPITNMNEIYRKYNYRNYILFPSRKQKKEFFLDHAVIDFKLKQEIEDEDKYFDCHKKYILITVNYMNDHQLKEYKLFYVFSHYDWFPHYKYTPCYNTFEIMRCFENINVDWGNFTCIIFDMDQKNIFLEYDKLSDFLINNYSHSHLDYLEQYGFHHHVNHNQKKVK